MVVLAGASPNSGMQGEWVVVDAHEARFYAEAAFERRALAAREARDKHRETVAAELAQAWEALVQIRAEIARAQSALVGTSASSGLQLACSTEDSVERQTTLCISQGTVGVSSISRSWPAIVTTQEPHGLVTGQRVAVSGVRGSEWLAINGEHSTTVEGEMEFTIDGTNTVVINVDADVTEAKIMPTSAGWESGSAPVLHGALFSAAKLSEKFGMPDACQRSFEAAMAVAVQALGVSASEGEQRENTECDVRPVWWTTLQAMSSRCPDFRSTGLKMWRSCVTSTQPSFWQTTAHSFECAECLKPWLRALDQATENPSQFESVFSKHHCRHCGHVVCAECSQRSAPVPWRGYAAPVRICESCVPAVHARNFALHASEELANLLVGLGVGLTPQEPEMHGPDSTQALMDSSAVPAAAPEDDRGLCVVCLDERACQTFVHGPSGTGHTACCAGCAETIERSGMPCPVCREPITAIIRVFPA